jgi:hypothetical protein
MPVIFGGGGRSTKVGPGPALFAKDVLAEGGADANTGRRSVVACRMGGGGKGGGLAGESIFFAGFKFVFRSTGWSLLLMMMNCTLKETLEFSVFSFERFHLAFAPPLFTSSHCLLCVR